MGLAMRHFNRQSQFVLDHPSSRPENYGIRGMVGAMKLQQGVF
jgi:hypothetical protein